MTSPDVPSFAEALRFWSQLGWISFGGPTGQIAIMHRELVERRKWVEEKRFLHALNYCMMLPGPEAQQLATFLGWSMHGVRGGLCSGLLFILPSIFILWALSLVYVWYGTVPVIAAAFYGLIPAILAIVFNATLKLAGKTLRAPLHWFIAIGAAAAISYFREGYPLVILGAGCLGWLFRNRVSTAPTATHPAPPARPIRIAPLLGIAATCIVLWIVPLLLAGVCLGWDHTVTQEGLFFSKAALITFGGAYAILPYVAQQAVESYHWLTPDQMMHGFGLAETTPGPLIMVLQFVGFMGAWNQPGLLSPLLAATLGSLLTTWVTFAPSFLFILTGAPFVDRLIGITALQSALTAISAAVVGVMASFALWFAFQAILPGGLASAHPDWFVIIVGAIALALLRLRQWDVVPLIGLCAVLGILDRLL